MDDKTQKIQEIAPAPDAPEKVAEPPAATPAPEEKKQPFITKGQTFHKWSTYLGIDWIFNAYTGVKFAYWGNFSKTGQEKWSGPITNFFTKVLKPIIKNEKQLEKSAGYGNIFMSIIAGGMFTLPPLLVLENNKVKKSLVKFYDKIFYGKERVENDPKFQEAYEAIQEAPKKDFWRGLTSRFAALAPLLAIVLIPVTKKASDKIWFDHVEKASEVTATKMGFSAEKSFKNVAPAEAKERWRFIHKSVAMDFGLGVPYAVLHQFFYDRFVAKKHKKDTAAGLAEPPTLAHDIAEAAQEQPGFAAAENKLTSRAGHAARELSRQADADKTPNLSA